MVNTPFCLMTSYPRKVFPSDDYKKTLDQLITLYHILLVHCSIYCYDKTIHKLNYASNKIINENVIILCKIWFYYKLQY